MGLLVEFLYPCLFQFELYLGAKVRIYFILTKFLYFSHLLPLIKVLN